MNPSPEDSEPDPIEAWRAEIETDHIRDQVVEPGKNPPPAENPQRTEAMTGATDADAEFDPADDKSHIGPYRLVRVLGRGGQAVVYLAVDPRLGRRVALKVLIGLGGASPGVLARFQREAELTSHLDHPSICSVYETGAVDGIPYIAMRFVEGRPLSEVIAVAKARTGETQHSLVFDLSEASRAEARTANAEPRQETIDVTTRAESIGRDDLRDILSLMEKTARALHVAHEVGIVHRDIKPGNIMVTPQNEPVIVDFGIASAGDLEMPTLTATGDLVGTPAYMSPEQVDAKPKAIDHRTDVYSLGITLFECLTLARPFTAPTREGLWYLIRSEAIPDPRKRNPHVTPELKIVLETATEKDADRRYRTALEFADDLARVRRLEPISARPVSAALRTRRWAQRNPVVATLLLALFAFLSTGLLWTWRKNRQLDEQRAVAETERANAEAALADVERLADIRVLGELEQREGRLWPVSPDLVPSLEDWLRDAAELTPRVDLHRAKLATLSGRARRVGPDAGSDEARRRVALLTRRTDLETRIEASEDEDEVARSERDLEALESELDELGAVGEDRLTFDLPEERWQHEVLTDLVARLEKFFDEDRGVVRDVRSRLEMARDIRLRTVEQHREEWRRVDEAVRTSGRYPKLAESGLPPQVGFIPLGVDPKTGYVELLHYMSHPDDPPQRDEKGVLQLDENAGIVFVLIPGGTAILGAQSDDAESPRYDRAADSRESPVHAVELEPFLLSKFEMTQAQWEDATGETPSHYTPEGRFGQLGLTARHPVEQISWNEAVRTLRRLGFELPTEAQWEWACRAGRDTLWPYGDQVGDLEGYENIADEGSASKWEGQLKTWPHEEGLDDGFMVHAPVGSFAPNAFGLHDMVGNVTEWCRDRFGAYYDDVEPGDGLRVTFGVRDRVARGGCFFLPAGMARVALRNRTAPDYRNGILGVRPAARLTR